MPGVDDVPEALGVKPVVVRLNPRQAVALLNGFLPAAGGLKGLSHAMA